MQQSDFSVAFDGAASVLSVSGEVDEARASELREAIAAHAGGDSDLVINLDAVTYLPSVAIGVLARARQEVASSGRSLDLVAAEGTIAQRVLAVCALPYRAS